MDSRSIVWFTLPYLNMILIIFGLYLPIKVPKSCSHQEKRKISGLVLFLIIGATVFSASWKYGLVEENLLNCYGILTTLVTGCSCCSIVAVRYFKFDKINTFFNTLLAIDTPSSIPSLIGKTELIILFKMNIFSIVKCIIFIVLMVAEIIYNILFNKTPIYYHIPAIFLELTLFLESLAIFLISSVLQETVKWLEDSLEEHHSDYYKVPPANIKKTEDGNFILTGWISSALSYNKNGNHVELIKDLLYNTFQLKSVIEIFNNIFYASTSVILVMIVFRFIDLVFRVVKYIEGSEKYQLLEIDIFKLLFWSVSISYYYIHSKLKNTRKSMYIA